MGLLYGIFLSVSAYSVTGPRIWDTFAFALFWPCVASVPMTFQIPIRSSGDLTTLPLFHD